MLRAILALALLLPFTACDVFGGEDPFDAPCADIYGLSATDEDGAAALNGRISLTYAPTDFPGVPDLYGGVWELEATGSLREETDAPNGSGSLRGDEADPTELQLFDDDERERPLSFYLVFDRRDLLDVGDFSGRWEIRDGITGGAVRSGAFRADLTREATDCFRVY